MKQLRQPVERRVSVLAALAIACASVAVADLTNVVFRVTASAGDSYGTFEVTQSQGQWVGDTFFWQLTTPQTITDVLSGQPLITLGSATTTYIGDPIINIAFQATNMIAAPVTIQIDSGLLSFPAINPAQASATAAITVTDFSGDGDGGAFVHGMTGIAGGKCYQANLNGQVPAGLHFASLVGNVVTSNEGGSFTGNEDTGGLQNVAGAITSMSARFHVELSGLDAMGGTSNFRVVPEPTSLALLLLGGGLLAIRRR